MKLLAKKNVMGEVLGWGFLMSWLVSVLLTPVLTHRWLDFPVYYEAGLKVLAHQTAYDVVTHFQFKYSPFIALCFGWIFGGMGFESASHLYRSLCFVGFGVLIFNLGLAIARQYSYVGAKIFIFVSVPIVFGNALKLDLELGQANVWPFLLMWMVLLSDDGKYKTLPKNFGKLVLNAFFLALAIQFKLYCILFVPILFLKRRFSLLFATLGATGFTLFLVPGLTHSFEFVMGENQAWINSLFQSSKELLASPYNVGMMGVLAKWGFHAFAIYLVSALGLCVLAIPLYKSSKNSAQSFTWVCFAIVLFNPLVWSYWVWFLIPALLAVICDFKRLSHGERWLLLVPFLFFNMQHARVAWNGGILMGVLVLLFLFYRVELRRSILLR